MNEEDSERLEENEKGGEKRPMLRRGLSIDRVK